MSLYEQIRNAYPELTAEDFRPEGVIHLRDDGDGAYIEAWQYKKPIPAGLKLGKD